MEKNILKLVTVLACGEEDFPAYETMDELLHSISDMCYNPGNPLKTLMDAVTRMMECSRVLLSRLESLRSRKTNLRIWKPICLFFLYYFAFSLLNKCSFFLIIWEFSLSIYININCFYSSNNYYFNYYNFQQTTVIKFKCI